MKTHLFTEIERQGQLHPPGNCAGMQAGAVKARSLPKQDARLSAKLNRLNAQQSAREDVSCTVWLGIFIFNYNGLLFSLFIRASFLV